MLGVAFYERLDQSCLAYPGRSNHGDNDRRSFLRQSVDQRNMQSLFFDLETFQLNNKLVLRAIGVHRGSGQLVCANGRGWRTQRPSDWILQLFSMKRAGEVEINTIRIRFLLLGLAMGFVGLVLHLVATGIFIDQNNFLSKLQDPSGLD